MIESNNPTLIMIALVMMLGLFFFVIGSVLRKLVKSQEE